MAKYLVTGGAGFIGSHLCDALIARGDEVRVLDNLSTGRRENLASEVEFILGDVTDEDAVQKASIDIDGCFHLAAIASVAQSTEDWVGTHEVNLTGAIRVLDAARATKFPVVYASSAAVYGDNASMPLCESDRASPLTPYGADKLGCELHARVASVLHNIPTTGMRFFNVYGPRQDPRSPYSGVISIFTDRLSRCLNIPIFGDGQQSRDFIFVGDVVRFLIAAMDRADTRAAIYNVCSGQSTNLRQLAQTLATVSGVTPQIEYLPARQGDIRASLGDPARAAKILNVRAEVSLGEGLSQTVSHHVTTTLDTSKAAE
ncbi:MAG: NAD-dependent epimerase/dehydratase family protein [Rhodospirillales bacterium]|nr:NAD-dependent epimerase/dehydratase family protein [Rhodospirillales bacterium]